MFVQHQWSLVRRLTSINSHIGLPRIFLSTQAKRSIPITFGSGIIGDLADASVLAKQGGTVVHAVVASSRAENPTEDFLALTVDYRDRSYAHGRIPSNPARRERNGTDDEVLVARIIDRTMRPLFPRGYCDEVQLTVTSHSVDTDYDSIVTAVNAASCALSLSSQPW